MNTKVMYAFLLIAILISFTGCREWIMFDLSRLAFGFIISLVMGIIGLIIMAFKGDNK